MPPPKTPTPKPIPVREYEGAKEIEDLQNLNESLLRTTTLQEYLEAHARGGTGWHAFFRSNLFAALIIFLLSQGIVFGGFLVTYYIRTTALQEWREKVDESIKRMDQEGSTYSHYMMEKILTKQVEIDTRLKHVEDDTRHIEVLESEHRRLTKDVEEIRNGKK